MKFSMKQRTRYDKLLRNPQKNFDIVKIFNIFADYNKIVLI